MRCRATNRLGTAVTVYRVFDMRRLHFTLVEILIVVAIIGLLVAIVIPSYVQSGNDTRTSACINNLRVIDYSQQQAMLQQNTDSPTPAQVKVYMRTSNSVCPASDEAYDLETTPPVCPSADKYPEHRLSD